MDRALFRTSPLSSSFANVGAPDEPPASTSPRSTAASPLRRARMDLLLAAASARSGSKPRGGAGDVGRSSRRRAQLQYRPDVLRWLVLPLPSDVSVSPGLAAQPAAALALS